MSGVFVTGGTMKPGAPTYIRRNADGELYHAVLAGEYCTVLTTRQMGKSSLMARTAVELREEGIACATVDLQGKGEKSPPPEQWYYGVVKQIADGLGLAPDWTLWWKQQTLLLPAQRMTDFLADIVLKQIAGRVVVFIDEVDWMIRLPFSDEFFAAVRSCFNRRATDPVFDRLTFVLLGSAAPAQLIRDATRTPFNVGRGIELTDFTPQEAEPLARWLGDDGEPVLARILHWTDGHPYLTQMLCAKAAEGTRVRIAPEALVDSIVGETLLSISARQEENNLKFVSDRLTQAPANLRSVLRIYRQVLRGKQVKDVPASPVHTSLRLSGAVKPDGQRWLRVRNRVYQRVFDEAWVRHKMPVSTPLMATVAAALVMMAALAGWYVTVYPKPYVDALETASNDVPYEAYAALNKPLHRARAYDLFAQFWERRGDRDQAILVRARAGDQAGLTGLVGTGYPWLKRTLRHQGSVESVAFSPDGKLVATGSEDKTARVFEASTGREVSRLAHQGSVTAVAFSPDGKLVATGSEDKTTRVFEAATGREVSRLAQQSDVTKVAFSPDVKLVATGSVDKMARVFEASTGREVSRLAHQDTVRAVAFSPDGKLVATGSLDETARVFEAATGREVSRLAHLGSVHAVAFSPDGRLVATASLDNTAVFEAATGREVSRLAQQSPVFALAFSPDGKLVATASLGNTAQVFEASTGREISRLAHLGSVNAVAFSPDGRLVATGSGDNTARVFEAATGREVLRLAQQSPVIALAFSPDGKLVATGSRDNTARVFEAAMGPEVSRLTQRGPVTVVAFSPDGKLVATGSSDILTELCGAILGFEVSRDNTARVFEAATGQEVSRLAHQDCVYAVAFSPDGKLVATGSEDHTARVFEAATGREVLHLAHQDAVMAVAFSPDGKLVATGSRDNTVRVFEAATGREVFRLAHQDSVSAVAFNSNGKLVATGSSDKTARVLEAATGREVSRLAHQSDVTGVAFSPDDKLLVTQTGNLLHLYQRDGDRWRPVANRHVPIIWPSTVRFMSTPQPTCLRCVEVVRDVPENLLKLDRINFDEHPEPPIQGDPTRLLAEWTARLGLTFDSSGRIVPLYP